MDDALVEGASCDRVQDGGVLEAEGGDGQRHDGARREVVMAGVVCGAGLISYPPGVVPAG
jgi:hypothetical protein